MLSSLYFRKLKMKSIVLFGFVLGALCAAENVVYIKDGATVMLKCGLTDISIKWLHENELLYNINLISGMASKGNAKIQSKSRVKNEKDLEISQVNTEDAGQFTCTAKEKKDVHRLVVTSVSITPSTNLVAGSSANLKCDVAGLTSGSAVWTRPDGQTEPSHIVNLNSVALSDAGTWKCVVDGKTIEPALTIQVREPTKSTLGPTTTTTRKTQDNAPACLECNDSTTGATPTWAGLSWWMWAAIGGGCLVFILIWVFVLVMYNRMSRRKRHYMKAMKGMQMKPKQFCQCQGPAADVGRRVKPSAPPPPPLSMQRPC